MKIENGTKIFTDEDFSENVELDAQLCFHAYANRDGSEASADRFMAVSEALGIHDPDEGIARGVWLRAIATPEYVAQVKIRLLELLAGQAV